MFTARKRAANARKEFFVIEKYFVTATVSTALDVCTGDSKRDAVFLEANFKRILYNFTAVPRLFRD